ncbi:MAG TPA: hypothetical protein VK466_07255 [Terriglobales bacterium]|nr:hypothetical protein [Terriglobales bacterium]
MKVLISGAGIAGPALAYWLSQYGFRPTLVEAAPRLRTGGYIVDFWGSGYVIADRMSLLPVIHSQGYRLQDVRVVNDCGETVSGFPADAFSRVTDGHYISVARGDLAALIYSKIDGKVETLFGDTISALDQNASCIHVSFERSPARDFDLVI